MLKNFTRKCFQMHRENINGDNNIGDFFAVTSLADMLAIKHSNRERPINLYTYLKVDRIEFVKKYSRFGVAIFY